MPHANSIQPAPQVHPFGPFFDSGSRILILGSFPSVKSREMNFFYGHPQNRFWPLLAGLMGEDAVPATVEERKAFLGRNHIALWDVIASCEIRGSSDSSIRSVVPNDLREILSNAPVEMIYANGKTAWKLYEKYIRPVLGIPAICLPSTSPANAVFRPDDLRDAWRRILVPLRMKGSYRSCRLCPRGCSADRLAGGTGFCKSPAWPVLARAALHPWEEPVISGTNGSGTVFFSGCTLRCCFCQNSRISLEGFGKAVPGHRLAEIFLELQEQGAHNINLVTASQYLPSVLEALEAVRGKLTIPVVYNTGGYETVEAVRELAPYVSVWLPDLKYEDAALSARYSKAGDYFGHALPAIREMIAQSGPPVLSGGLMTRGVLIRHMVLPGAWRDSVSLLQKIKKELPEGSFLLSILRQYTPFGDLSGYPEINRRLTTYEYEKVVDCAISLGLTSGFMQEKSSAREEYTPPFELQGL